jgi:type IV secretory pathway TrbL component
MKRIVLALLALLGLFAQGAPAQAGLCGVGIAQVGTVVAPRVQGQALAAQAVASEVAAKPDRKERACRQPTTDRKRPVYIPSVQLGSDRARE